MSLFRSKQPARDELVEAIQPEQLDPHAPIGDSLLPPAPVAGALPVGIERGGWEGAAPFAPAIAPESLDGHEPPEPDEGGDADDDDDPPVAAGSPVGPDGPEPQPCLCGLFEVIDPETGGVVQHTDCTGTTKKRFAPGHDAKLKSLLISAGVHGRRIRERNGKSDKLHRPITVANRFGFGEQVKRAIDKRRRSW